VLTQTKRVALLAYLLLSRPGESHRRDSLLALFWPEMDQEHGRNSLQGYREFATGYNDHLFQERLDHFLSGPPADQARFPLAIAESYMMADHLTEARTLLDSISSAASGSIPLMGQFGVVAALQGDTMAAQEMMEGLGAM